MEAIGATQRRSIAGRPRVRRAASVQRSLTVGMRREAGANRIKCERTQRAQANSAISCFESMHYHNGSTISPEAQLSGKIHAQAGVFSPKLAKILYNITINRLESTN